MNFLNDLVKKRRSIRDYSDKEIPDSDLLKCIEAARYAPSACNVEPWEFIILKKRKVIDEFSRHAFSGIYFPTKFAEKATCIVVLCANLDLFANVLGKQITGTNYYLIDLGIAGEHFVLQATELGIGTCWIGWFDPKKVKNYLKLPESKKVVACISLGYPKGTTLKSKKRKKLEEIYSFYEG